MNRLPDFLIVGATKCGTSSIYHYLKQHPAVHMPSLKEINFFLNSDSEQHKRSAAANIDEYASYFEDCPGGAVTGEVAPTYLSSPIAAQNIRRAIPAAKIFIILRDPVKRSFSAFIMAARNGRTDINPMVAFQNREAAFVRGSLYSERIRLFLDAFPQEQIRILLYDDFVADNIAFMQSLYRDLGVDGFYTPNVGTRSNPAYLVRNRAIHSFLTSKLVRRKIIPHLPRGLHRMGVKFRGINAREIPVLSPELETSLRHFFIPDLQKTQELIQQDLSAWMSV